MGNGDSILYKRLLDYENLREVSIRKTRNSKNIVVYSQLPKIVTAGSYRLLTAVKKATKYM